MHSPEQGEQQHQEHVLLPDAPATAMAAVGLFSLNGIFKAGCFAGLITANHTWGAEWGFAELLRFSRKDFQSGGWPGVGRGLIPSRAFPATVPCGERAGEGQVRMPDSG